MFDFWGGSPGNENGSGGGGAGNGKVKVDANDTQPGYLAEKVDGQTLDVDTENHKVKVKDDVFASANDLAQKEDKSNKITSWSSNPSDIKYPSERLVKVALNNKANKHHRHYVADIRDFYNGKFYPNDEAPLNTRFFMGYTYNEHFDTGGLPYGYHFASYSPFSRLPRNSGTGWRGDSYSMAWPSVFYADLRNRNIFLYRTGQPPAPDSWIAAMVGFRVVRSGASIMLRADNGGDYRYVEFGLVVDGNNGIRPKARYRNGSSPAEINIGTPIPFGALFNIKLLFRGSWSYWYFEGYTSIVTLQPVRSWIQVYTSPRFNWTPQHYGISMYRGTGLNVGFVDAFGWNSERYG